MDHLLVKTFLGFAFLLACLALALFLAAGTIYFWQAWAFLGVFAGCTILITAYLIKYDQRLLAGRVRATPMAETQKSQQVIQSLASIFFIGVFIAAGLDQRFHWSNVPAGVSILSEGLVILGFFIVFLVFRENSFTSGTIEVADEQRVVTSGPYSLVRHPMYAGAILLLIFTPPALGSWAALPFVLPLILVVAARLTEEERFLGENLAGYEEYRRKVQYRLIPFVW
jgi:protein-S-isoprenylcysteine O-methyltransferase Ste14